MERSVCFPPTPHSLLHLINYYPSDCRLAIFWSRAMVLQVCILGTRQKHRFFFIQTYWGWNIAIWVVRLFEHGSGTLQGILIPVWEPLFKLEFVSESPLGWFSGKFNKFQGDVNSLRNHCFRGFINRPRRFWLAWVWQCDKLLCVPNMQPLLQENLPNSLRPPKLWVHLSKELSYPVLRSTVAIILWRSTIYLSVSLSRR